MGNETVGHECIEGWADNLGILAYNIANDLKENKDE